MHKDFDIVEIRHTRPCSKYDPFTFANFVSQVYCVSYLMRRRDNQDWWVVIKTIPRYRVNSQYTLKVAYQEKSMSNAKTISNDVQIDNLRDDGYKTVDIDVIPVTHDNEEEEEGLKEKEEEEEEEEDE